MPTLENRRPLTHDQMLAKATSVALAILPGGPGYRLSFAITTDVDPVVLVWNRGTSATPNPCIGNMQDFVPDAVICPWCETNLIGRPHGGPCDRPGYLYSAAECGQPDYDRW